MEFLNRAIAQIADLFRSMTPGARITVGLLLTVVVVSLAYLFNHQSTSADYFLLGGDPIPSNQLPAIEAAFSKAKLGGYEIDSSHRIRVPAGQKTAYLAALADGNALPKSFGDHIGLAMKDAGTFAPTSQRKELLKVAEKRNSPKSSVRCTASKATSVMYDEPTESGLHEKSARKQPR